MWITRNEGSQWIEIYEDYYPYHSGRIHIDGTRPVHMYKGDFRKLFGWTPKQLCHDRIDEIKCKVS